MVTYLQSMSKNTEEKCILIKRGEIDMFYRCNETIIYGLGQNIQVTAYPQQKWEWECSTDDSVIITYKNITLILNKDEFNEHWREVR